MQEKKLKIYCAQRFLDCEIEDGIMIFQDKEYWIVPKDHILFDEEMKFLPISEYDVDGFIYEFGGRWYLQNAGEETSLDEFRYKGKSTALLPTEAFLGIHSGNELLNGSGLIKDWIKKGKFMGCTTLGICEKHTLNSVIEFQAKCRANDIKPIIGMALDIKSPDTDIMTVKLYAKDYAGWQNLLKFNEKINVDGDLFVDADYVYDNLDGVFLVFDPKTTKHGDTPGGYYYQLDTVEFGNEEKDKWYLDNLEAFITGGYHKPIAIFDAYYLEKEDWEVREILWGIGKTYYDKTKNQYFKSNQEYAMELIQMHSKDCDSWNKLYKEATKNLENLISECNFEYDTENRRLPKYVMTEDQAKRFPTKEALFIHLIESGFKERNIKDMPKYMDRLKEEIRVLQKGDVIDYFLVLYDIIQFAKRENILVGIGRGSAGGSLVSYLLGIIQVNPLDFDLLFERFLNDGRMGFMQECDAYEIETDQGTIILNEGSVVRVLREEREMIIFIEDLRKEDEILKY